LQVNHGKIDLVITFDFYPNCFMRIPRGIKSADKLTDNKRVQDQKKTYSQS